MSKITTLNQLIGYFDAFANAHAQINDFGYGATSEMSTSEQINYPLLWVTNASSSTIEVSRNKSVIPILTFQFIVLDQWNNQSNYKDTNGLESNNTGEIMSDTQQICMDIINYISNYLREQDVFIPDGSVTIEPAQDEGTDKQYGWILTLDLQILNLNCTIPGDFNNIIPPNPCECDSVYVSNSDDSYMANVESGGVLELPVDQNNNPITPDNVVSNKIIVTTGGSGSADSLQPTRSGQTTSYAVGDDGDLELGRDNSFSTLSWINPFGNNDRFTDMNGLQVYGNKVLIDWSSYSEADDVVDAFILSKDSNSTGTKNWVDWMAGIPYTTADTLVDGFTLANIRQIQILMDFDNVYPLNYVPFNHINSGTADELYTSTADVSLPNYRMLMTSRHVTGSRISSTIRRALLSRQFTLSELGL